MYFYKMEAKLLNYSEKMSSRSFACVIEDEQISFMNNSGREIFIFINRIRSNRLILGVIARENKDIETRINNFLENMDFECELGEPKEITLDMTIEMMAIAARCDFIERRDEIFAVFDLFELSGHYKLAFDSREELINGDEEKVDTVDINARLAKAIVNEELERINTKPAIECRVGHPVHYIVSTDLEQVSDKVDKILLCALYSNKRLESRRYTVFDIDTMQKKLDDIDRMYRISSGGTVIINFKTEVYEDGNYLTEDVSRVGSICSLAERYKGKVLTVFNIPKRCSSLKRKIYESIRGISFVEIAEQTMTGERAKKYLCALAEESGLNADENLLEYVTDKDRAYRSEELNRNFDKWLDHKLKNEIYPQYRDITTSELIAAKQKPKGSAYDELMEMVGLDNVKAVVNDAIKFYKAQRIFERRGMQQCKPAMHMVFTGNPGTAKTTVARLLAQIMKDNGILSVGDLYELGRADLVGKYVGWTAPTVKNKFRMAKGSVLFIDEAYSLVEEHNSFGNEAINTIVQEMENNREDIIVIFAGYPKEMEDFLNKNPGLRSRIAFHIDFEDYNSDELYSITELIAKRAGLQLDNGVRERLLPIFDDARKNDDFGNGRFARNLFEKAKMKQAGRLIDTENIELLTDSDISTILPEDFDAETQRKIEQKKTIGFV